MYYSILEFANDNENNYDNSDIITVIICAAALLTLSGLL
jgi:hypothetical protein